VYFKNPHIMPMQAWLDLIMCLYIIIFIKKRHVLSFYIHWPGHVFNADAKAALNHFRNPTHSEKVAITPDPYEPDTLYQISFTSAQQFWR
jgi:hypothetical protein